MANLGNLIVRGVTRILGDAYANKFIGNLQGNADTATSAIKASTADSATNAVSANKASIATAVQDYGTSDYREIKIGYNGSGLSSSDITHAVGFTDGGTKIKDISKDEFRNWLATASGIWNISITGNAATATNADKLGNIAANNYFKDRDAIFNSEWSGKYLWTLWDNHLYAADKRLAITLTGTTSTNFSLLFDGSFESSVSITEAKAVLHIRSTTEGNVWTEGLPYGDFYVVFYNSDAENITGRVYCNYASQGTGWHDLTVTHVGPHIWKLNNVYYQLSDLEITITKPVSSASIDLCQVLHVVERSPSPYYAAVMSKYCDQKTNYNIEAAKFIKTGGTSSQFLKADGSVDSNTYSKSDHKHSFSDITPGVATIGDGANRLMFRTNSSYKNGIYYSTSGNEALVFGTITPITSWIFATTDPTTQTAWTSLTPSLQIKNGRVTINKLIANNTDASYNLDVNGSVNATTLYENGVRVSVNGHTHDYLPLNGGTMTNPINFSYNNNGDCNVSRGSGFSMFFNTQSDADVTNQGFPCSYSSVVSFMTGYCGMQFANYGGTNDNRLFFRNISDKDVWTPWYTLIHSDNYNAYAPKLDGTGASGTWGISITGNAATASNASAVNGVSFTWDGEITSSQWIAAWESGTSIRTMSAYNTFISMCSYLDEGSSDVTDGTMFITSYATDNGFADPNGKNKPYKRKASLLWNYINNKCSNIYATQSWVNSNYYTCSESDSRYIQSETDPVWTAAKVNYYTKTECNNKFQPKGTYLTERNLQGYATQEWVRGEEYLYRSGGTMDARATIGITTKLFIGNSTSSDTCYTKFNCILHGGGDESNPNWAIRDNGYAEFKSSVSANAFYASSDIRLKNILDDINIDFDKLKLIPKKYYTWKGSDILQLGTIAQDIQKIYPEVVSKNENGYLSVDYSKLSIIALAAIDKLNERIKELECQIKL